MISEPIRIFLLTYVAYCSAYSTRKPFSIVKAVIEKEYDFGTSALGLLDAAFLVSYALGQLVLPSRLELLGGDRKCLIYAFCGSGVASFIFASGSHMFTFFTAFVLNGFLHSIIYPTMIKLLVPHFAKSRRGETLGLWCTSQHVGSLAAAGLSTWSADRLGWRMTFYMTGWIVICSGCAISLFLGREQEVPTKSVLSVPGICNIAAAFFCVKCVRYALLLWIPYYLGSFLSDLSPGYISMFFDIGGIIGAIMSGFASDRWLHGNRFLLALGMSLLMAAALPVFFVMSYGDNVPALCLSLLVLGAFVAGPDIILGASGAVDLCERYGLGMAGLGTAIGVVNGTGSVGAVFQGLLTGYIAGRYGWQALFRALSVVSLITAICLIKPVLEERRNTHYLKAEDHSKEGRGMVLGRLPLYH